MVENAHSNKKNASSKKLGSRAVLELIAMLVKGIEPPAYALRVRCSTPELHQQVSVTDNKNYYTLSYIKNNHLHQLFQLGFGFSSVTFPVTVPDSFSATERSFW